VEPNSGVGAATAIRTTTVVDPNWFNEDLDPKNAKRGSGKGGSE
jgi:hypothetical protein